MDYNDYRTKSASELEALSALAERDFARLEAGKNSYQSRTKAAAILAGAQGVHAASDGPTSFLKAIKDARSGDPDANYYVKAVLGTSDATGLALVPNNFVASLAEQTAARNVFRQLMAVHTGITSSAIDVPYETTAITAALVQGAFGSNKDVRDFSFNQATATLYTIAQIADVGNQLLRQSGGGAEAAARRRLGESIGLTESSWIVSGTGSGQPLGILPALLAYGDVAANKYALSSESRAAALANGMAKLESRGVTPTAIVMNPSDYWKMVTETLGTSGSGGWAIDPADGAPSGRPRTAVWGVPVYRSADMTSGTAIAADWSAFDIWIGQDFRIDVSSEAGSRFDQNVTGFRAEEDFGFTAEPPVRTGKVVKITGIS